MHVHELLLRRRNVEQRVALRRHFAEPAADQQHEIGRLDPREQLRIRRRCRDRRRNMDAARSKRCARRNVVATGSANARRSAPARRRPLPTSGCRRASMIGRSAAQSSFCSCAHVGEAGPGLDRLDARRVGDRDALGQHVLRQRDHHRPGPAVGRGVEGARHDFRNARRIVDLGRPFRHRAEHGAVVEFLERLALAHVARDLADEQDHRRRILLARCACRATHWWRRARA